MSVLLNIQFVFFLLCAVSISLITAADIECYICSPCNDPFDIGSTGVSTGIHCNHCYKVDTYIGGKITKTSRSCLVQDTCQTLNAVVAGNGNDQNCCNNAKYCNSAISQFQLTSRTALALGTLTLLIMRGLL